MANVINNGIPPINGMLCGWADIVVLIGGVPITGIVALDYNESRRGEQMGRGSLPGRASQRQNFRRGQNRALHGGSARAGGTGTQRPPSGLATIRHYRAVSPGLRHNQDRQAEELPILREPRKWKEGDTGQEVELPLVMSHIERS